METGGRVTGWPGEQALTPAVTVLTGTANGKYPAGNSLLVRGTDHTAIVDPSTDISTAGGPPVPVDHVVLSHVHEDHLAGLHTVPDATVWAHPADLVGLTSLDGIMQMYGMGDGPSADAWRTMLVDDFRYVARPEARALHPGERLDLGGVSLRLHHLPGHTRGHSAVVVEQPGQDTVAFVGDIDLSSFGPYYGDAWSDLDDFVRSLDDVRSLDARWFVTFHHKGVVEGCERFAAAVERFAAVIDDRDERLLAFLDGPRTMDEIVAHRFIYRPGVDLPFVDSVERRSMSMHLARLAERGRVEQDGSGRWARSR